MTLDCVLVSHTHWDREWYRTFQEFRARLVDAVDRLLELLAADPGYRFVLDGQAVVLEDYLEVRPGRRAALEDAIRSGRVTTGPWYVQPDCLLPAGETHVRNLLEGRRVAGALGPVSRVAYVPDSFGHPAQLPQLFAGFGLGTFVYSRGDGEGTADLPAEYTWVAPDGSRVLAHDLPLGYLGAAALDDDPDAAADRLVPVVEHLAGRTRNRRVLLMNGFDHRPPDPGTGAVATALAARTGASVTRGSLDDFVAELDHDAPEHRGELVGGRVAPLLPGVWSTRLPLKLRNRRCEAALAGWAEPWTALGTRLGLADESPSLRVAWRSLLLNQAHDSICGCSLDRVHEQMAARFDTAAELASATTVRILERLSGRDTTRAWPWSTSFDVDVYNPSPHPRGGVVRLVLDPEPTLVVRAGLGFGSVGDGTSPAAPDAFQLHPVALSVLAGEGFAVDGVPARPVPLDGRGGFALLPEPAPFDLELLVDEIPAFGRRRVHVEPAPRVDDDVDDGREIATDDLAVRVVADGTLTVRLGGREWSGLAALDDVGDRGDTYDHDPVPGPVRAAPPVVRRSRHPSGIQHVVVEHVLDVPGLDAARTARSGPGGRVRVTIDASVAPGLGRVDLDVAVDNGADDHRLRLRFPTGAPTTEFLAATTFDVARRSTRRPDDTGWAQPAPATFPHQGWIAANGLTVVAPGLPEGEVLDDGTIAVTLLRAVGWLSRPDLTTRPEPAGPALATPGAQCRTPYRARLSLIPGVDPRAAADAELGLRAVVAGSAPPLLDERPLLEILPREVLLSACKPADDGDGTILRLLNPTAEPLDAVVRTGFPIDGANPCRLDETPVADDTVTAEGSTVRTRVGAHALVTLRLR